MSSSCVDSVLLITIQILNAWTWTYILRYAKPAFFKLLQTIVTIVVNYFNNKGHGLLPTYLIRHWYSIIQTKYAFFQSTIIFTDKIYCLVMEKYIRIYRIYLTYSC